LIKYYTAADLGKRKDGKGGKRVIVFAGCSKRNYDVAKALKEKSRSTKKKKDSLHSSSRSASVCLQ